MGWSLQAPARAPILFDEDHDEAMRHPILFVEDHEETRALFAELLRSEGYEVVEARDAVSALGELRTAQFSLLLSDHWLDNGDTGLQMIEQARADGLLDGVPVILCTAERSIHGVPADIPVLRKPVDVNVLLSLVTKMSSAAAARHVTGPHARPLHPPPSSRALLAREAAREPVDLVFYVSKSAVSEQALRTLMASLARYEADAFRLSVVDLTEDPTASRAIEDRVALTPMLVTQAAGGRRERVVGGFDDPTVLDDVLERAGLPLREA